MGNSIMKKLIAFSIALALVMTSGIGVFAAESPKAGKVSNVTSVASTTKVKVTWKKASNAKTYNIYVNGKLKKSGVTGTSYTVTGLKSGSSYTIQVAGVNAGGKVGTKSSATTYTKGNAESALAKRWLKATKIKKAKAGKKKATVTWKAVKGAKKYQILQYKSGKWQVVKTVGKTTKATIKGLKKGKKYKFKVRALNSKGFVGIWSGTKTTKKIK